MNKQATTETRTFTVPNISCSHCVHSIKTEVGEIAGVTEVQVDEKTKVVHVSWHTLATWDGIVAALKAIDYPPVLAQ